MLQVASVYKVVLFGCFFKVTVKGWHYFVIPVIALTFSEVPPVFSFSTGNRVCTLNLKVFSFLKVQKIVIYKY